MTCEACGENDAPICEGCGCCQECCNCTSTDCDCDACIDRREAERIERAFDSRFMPETKH